MSRRSAYILLLIPAIIWCAGFMLVPLLPVHSEAVEVASRFYGRVCHRISERSWTWGLVPWGVCVRCSAIYLAFTLTLAAVPLVRRLDRWRPLSPPAFAAWLVPVIADAALDLFGLHGANAVSRTATGILAGVGLALTITPLFLEALVRLSSVPHPISPGDLHA
jgi:uncharacterized membrane protein